MTTPGRRRHTARWVAGAALFVLAAIGVVLATRTPQEATAVDSPLVGHVAPAISGTSLSSGAPVSLRSLRGHYVFVNFFASWCIPCQQEAPDLVTYYYQDGLPHRVDIMSVVYHDEIASAASFLKSQGEVWTAVSDPGGGIAEQYGVTGPPTTYLIDPTGRITVQPETGPATQADLVAMMKDATKLARSTQRAHHG